MPKSCTQAKILIVDDEKVDVRLLELMLQQAGFLEIYSTCDPRQALPLFTSIRPDLIMLDLSMPHLDGFEVMDRLQDEILGVLPPILVLIAQASPAIKAQALRSGASDFVAKPLEEVEVLLRVRNLLSSRFRSDILEDMVQERTHDLRNAQVEMLYRLALAAEYRDDATGMHTKRVGMISRRLAEALGLSPTEVDLIAQAAPLHDVGKIVIPDEILLKETQLTDEEFATIKKHTTAGARILSGSGSPMLRTAEEIALFHHERWDGQGYSGLKGDEIPLSGRIVAIVDTFDALTNKRPYKDAWTIDAALAEIDSQIGTQFDPHIATTFLELCADLPLPEDTEDEDL